MSRSCGDVYFVLFGVQRQRRRRRLVTEHQDSLRRTERHGHVFVHTRIHTHTERHYIDNCCSSLNFFMAWLRDPGQRHSRNGEIFHTISITAHSTRARARGIRARLCARVQPHSRASTTRQTHAYTYISFPCHELKILPGVPQRLRRHSVDQSCRYS